MNQQLLIYGKIIIDSVRVRSGDLLHSSLGGGGPQAAFGMRLWHDSVALLTRSGTDLDPALEQALRRFDLDLTGWVRFPDLPTPRGLVEYDEHERMLDQGLLTDRGDWFRLLDQPLTLSDRHRQAAGIHLITEFGHEPFADAAQELQRHAARQLPRSRRAARLCPPGRPDHTRLARSQLACRRRRAGRRAGLLGRAWLAGGRDSPWRAWLVCLGW
jgi:sugar/nucleoside kinase (ribokinase family)